MYAAILQYQRLPVITALDNTVYTHQSVNAAALKDSIRTGQGIDTDPATQPATPANAYVDYVKPDGDLERLDIGADRIRYEVENYKPLTVGSYTVMAVVNDDQTVGSASQQGVLPAAGTTQNTVTVKDKIYTVILMAGDYGSFLDGKKVQVTTVHGRPVTLPELDTGYGYQVDRWKTEAGNVISDIERYPITSDSTLRVSFKLKEYEVRFFGRYDRLIREELVQHGYSATPPADDKDVRDKRFDGWSQSYQNVTSDRDLYTTYRTSLVFESIGQE